MKCPNCNSEDLEDTEHATIYPDEIDQEFRCQDCGAEFDIKFAPIFIGKFTLPENEETLV